MKVIVNLKENMLMKHCCVNKTFQTSKTVFHYIIIRKDSYARRTQYNWKKNVTVHDIRQIFCLSTKVIFSTLEISKETENYVSHVNIGKDLKSNYSVPTHKNDGGINSLVTNTTVSKNLNGL